VDDHYSKLISTVQKLECAQNDSELISQCSMEEIDMEESPGNINVFWQKAENENKLVQDWEYYDNSKPSQRDLL
jgi:hypothetical protein